MRTGRINEIPDNLYYPPTPDQRLTIIERIIKLCEDDILNLRLISDNEIEPTKRLAISVFERKSLIVAVRRKDNSLCFATINEKDITCAVGEYFEYLLTTDMILGRDETVAFLRGKCEEYRVILSG